MTRGHVTHMGGALGIVVARVRRLAGETRRDSAGQRVSEQSMVALATVATAISAIIGGVTSVLIERIRAGKRADETEARLAEQIEGVRKLAAPTGNGFAAKVTETLEKLVRSDESQLATLGHLSEQIARLDKRMWDHIERHP